MMNIIYGVLLSDIGAIAYRVRGVLGALGDYTYNRYWNQPGKEFGCGNHL